MFNNSPIKNNVLPFPSVRQDIAVAEELEWGEVDLNELITGGKPGFFFYIVDETSDCVAKGDMVIANRSLEAKLGDWVFVGRNGKGTVYKYSDVCNLKPDSFKIFSVVTHVIKTIIN